MASAKQNKDLAFNQALHDLAAHMTKRGAREKKLKVFCSALTPIGEFGMAAGLPGTLDLCLTLQAALENTTEITGVDFDVLAHWPAAMLSYAAAPEAAVHKNRLIEILRHPAWGAAISAEDEHVIRTLLDITLATDQPTGSTELSIEDSAVTAAAVPSTPSAPARVCNQQLPAQIREYLEIMLTELAPIAAQIKRAAELQRGGSPENALQPLLDEIAVTLEFYSEAVASIDFKGLAQVIAHARENIRVSVGRDQSARTDLLHVLDAWTESVLVYLQDPVDTVASTAMLELLRRLEWLAPVTDAQLQDIQTLFAAQVFVDTKDSKPARQQQATAADVSIELPDDISRDLLEAMLQELPDQIQQLTTSIQRLRQGGTLEDIQIAKRIAHTLKGAGNTVGIRGIATLTHHLEDILLALYKHETLPPARIMETLTLATDCLAAMSEALLGMGTAPEDARQVLQEVLDLANRIDQHGLADLMTSAAAGQTTVPRLEHPADQAPTGDAVGAEPAATLRIPAAFLDRLLRLAGETIITNSQIRNQLLAVLEQVRDTQQYFNDLRQFSHKIEEVLDTKDLVRHPARNGGADFDALELDHYTELHTWVRQLVEKAVDIEEASQQVRLQLQKLDETLLDQARMNEEIKESVERNRLVAASQHFPRLQRSVRQAAKLTGKQVELQMAGGDTLIDSDVLNRLIDPLLHLLRNAVDHGIEPADRRRAAGKAAGGTIKLSFLAEGGDIWVGCEDDGRGLDLQAIRAKAEALGLIDAGQSVSDEQLMQFILRPDFSTRTEATQISGRGIGLDAVYTAITALSGSVAIHSVCGQGARFDIRLPANQISVHAVLAGVGTRVVVMASRGIDQVVYHGQAALEQRDGNLVLKMEGQEYPATNLQSVLNIVAERRTSSRQPPAVVVFNNVNPGKAALLVDRIISCGNVLIKTMGPYVPKIPGILGVTVLGDGSVSPVLDMVELLRLPPGAVPVRPRTVLSAPRLPTALVVDDSLSARRALAQFMRDAGYDVRTARDGIEAFDLIRAHKPDILISDLEMPRMNGLELAGHVRANAGLADLPIIMITSRSAAVHQQEAARAGINAYLTKPYSEDELLERIHGLRAIH